MKRLELEAPLGRTLREQVLARIRQAIISGELAPGDPLRQDQLAEWLDVSSTPVREAIADLAREQLVDLEPNRGARVRALTRKNATDLTRTYRLLFETAYQWGLPNLAAEDYDRIDALIEDLRTCCSRGEYDPAFEIDMSIHETVFSAADNRDLNALLGSLKSRVHRLISLRFPDSIWEETPSAYDQMFGLAREGRYDEVLSRLSQIWDLWEQQVSEYVGDSVAAADA